MVDLEQHPTVLRTRALSPAPAKDALTADLLRSWALEAGADDAGVVSIDRPEIADESEQIRRWLPRAKTLLSFVVRMNREPIRTPARSAANLEFHHKGDHINEIAGRLVAKLERCGVAAVNPAMGFPMEMDEFPGRAWVVSHKRVAEAAGLGVMGIHRNIIHPKFGNFILLGTVVIEAETEEESTPLDYNPCLECKLCVAACPVGAISPTGDFNFQACYTHNYREFMGGFTDWVEQVADSKSASDYRGRVEDNESASMWQSLSFGANYKSAYCLSACPAGEDVISPWLDDRKRHLDEVVKPLQQKVEPIYVAPGTDAEEHVAKRFPHKRIRRVGSGLRPRTARGFLDGVPLTFQPGKSKGLSAVYHFRIGGEESLDATITIEHQQITTCEGLHGKADLVVEADSKTWLEFLRRDRGIAGALLTRKIRLRGSPKLLLAFGKCFPQA